MNKNDMLIQEINELINIKKKELKECDDELKNWDYSYIVRTALGHYKLDLEEDIERYNNKLIDALKKEKGIS